MTLVARSSPATTAIATAAGRRSDRRGNSLRRIIGTGIDVLISSSTTTARGQDGSGANDLRLGCAFAACLSDHAHATAASPPTGWEADEFEAGAPGDDDDGAAVFGADGADEAVGGGFVEVDGGWGGGVDLDGEGEGVLGRMDFLVWGVDGPFWREAFFASLEERGC